VRGLRRAEPPATALLAVACRDSGAGQTRRGAGQGRCCCSHDAAQGQGAGRVKRPDPKVKAKPCINYQMRSPA
jgi:hypothetical protein